MTVERRRKCYVPSTPKRSARYFGQNNIAFGVESWYKIPAIRILQIEET